jgi:DNA-binding NarL/FixJ family response regulator
MRHEPDACIVDVHLGGDGFHAAAEMAARAPSVAVVLLVDDDCDEQFLEAIRLGATGYVRRTIAPGALANVVRAVAKGESAIPRSLVRALIDDYRDRPARRLVEARGGRGVDLTAREWEVLSLMRDDLSTREIADRLRISEVTVRRHISAVVKKLRVESRADALKLLHTA